RERLFGDRREADPDHALVGPPGDGRERADVGLAEHGDPGHDVRNLSAEKRQPRLDEFLRPCGIAELLPQGLVEDRITQSSGSGLRLAVPRISQYFTGHTPPSLCRAVAYWA